MRNYFLQGRGINERARSIDTDIVILCLLNYTQRSLQSAEKSFYQVDAPAKSIALRLEGITRMMCSINNNGFCPYAYRTHVEKEHLFFCLKLKRKSLLHPFSSPQPSGSFISCYNDWTMIEDYVKHSANVVRWTLSRCTTMFLQTWSMQHFLFHFFLQ